MPFKLEDDEDFQLTESIIHKNYIDSGFVAAPGPNQTLKDSDLKA